MPRSLIRIGIVQFFSWIGLFCMWTFKSTWWGKVAYPGCTEHEVGTRPRPSTRFITKKEQGAENSKSHSLLFLSAQVQLNERDCTSLEQVDRYNEGVKMNDTVDVVAYAGQTIVGILLGLLLTYRHEISLKYLYSGMLFVGAVLFYLLSFCSAKISLGVVLLSMICLPIVAINSIPFALVGAYNRAQTDRENDTGTQGVPLSPVPFSLLSPLCLCLGASQLTHLSPLARCTDGSAEPPYRCTAGASGLFELTLPRRESWQLALLSGCNRLHLGGSGCLLHPGQVR